MKYLSTIAGIFALCGTAWPAGATTTPLPVPAVPSASATYAAPLAQKAPPEAAPSPVVAGFALLLPLTAGGYLAAALLRARRMACPPCPACGSRRGAVVGPVGQYHNCCRCHDCGHLWEKDAAAMSGAVAGAARAHRPPGELY